MEILPCSHVGHLFRHAKYSFEGDEELIKSVNHVRFVEVWMEKHKEFFYAKNRGETLRMKLRIFRFLIAHNLRFVSLNPYRGQIHNAWRFEQSIPIATRFEMQTFPLVFGECVAGE